MHRRYMSGDHTKTRMKTNEEIRLDENACREKNWERWGPYLSERQWATVREDYSAYGSCWDYFPHDQFSARAASCAASIARKCHDRFGS